MPAFAQGLVLAGPRCIVLMQEVISGGSVASCWQASNLARLASAWQTDVCVRRQEHSSKDLGHMTQCPSVEHNSLDRLSATKFVLFMIAIAILVMFNQIAPSITAVSGFIAVPTNPQAKVPPLPGRGSLPCRLFGAAQWHRLSPRVSSGSPQPRGLHDLCTAVRVYQLEGCKDCDSQSRAQEAWFFGKACCWSED